MSIPSSDAEQAGLSRAAQRKKKLLELEHEQHLEDLEALKMTSEQRHTLWMSFQGVKVDLYPLDGLTWFTSSQKSDPSSPTPDRRPHAHYPNRPPHSPTSPAFAILTNSKLACPDDTSTIRASRQPHPSSHLPSRSRSPVKGLFPSAVKEVDEFHGNNWGTPSSSVSGDAGPAHEQHQKDPGILPSEPKRDTPEPTFLQSSPTRYPSVKPIVVVSDKILFDDDDMKTPIAPRRSSSDWVRRSIVQAGGVKRKR